MHGTIWCLHGAVGMADDWRGFSVPGWAVKRVDLWRFLDCCPMEMPDLGKALNEEVSSVERGAGSGERKVLLGYSMGGRLALHALLQGGPWDAAVIVSAHPGLEDEEAKKERRARDAEWAAKALKGDWRDFLEAWEGQAVLAPGVHDRDGHATRLGLADRKRLEMRRQAVARSFMDWSLGGQEPLGGRLGGIHCPLLWVAGERDGKFRALMEEACRRAADQTACPGSGQPRPHLERWVAPGAGHRVPWESAEFPQRVGEFLERAVS